MKTLELSDAEYEHIVTALQGAIEEFEEVERTVDYFVSLTPERLLDVLEIIQRDTDK